MSGSGNGGSGRFEPYDACESLVINTQLSSPKDEVIHGIKIGDVLDVGVQTINNTTVVVVLHGGKIAGGIASPQVQRLRECIEQGTQYDAKVASINGGQVQIRIEAKK